MKISIIVPVYNVEKYLAKCLDSLVNQTLKDIEIILVDDGSIDGSKQIIDKYLAKYPEKIKYFYKENGGQASARNYALKKASGQYITFVDSDDWVELDMCEKLYDVAHSTNSDIVCSNFYTTDGVNIIMQNINLQEENVVKKYILSQSGPCFKLINKDLIVENNLFFPLLRAYEDIAVVPIWGMFAKKITFINEPLYYYLIREGSTMKQTKYSEKLEHIFDSVNFLYEKFNKQYIEELEWLYIDHLLHSASLRFFKFENYKKNINKINNIIKDKFPNWKNNKYYKKQSLKYKIVCSLFYKRCYWLLRIILK